MSDSSDDASKKARLINAWIAVGPEGKTTDVSEVTDSSRGYASDIRRGLEGDDDEELSLEEIRTAYDPDLVERYRSELDADAIFGDWQFVDALEETEADERAGTPGIDRGQHREPDAGRSADGDATGGERGRTQAPEASKSPAPGPSDARHKPIPRPPKGDQPRTPSGGPTQRSSVRPAPPSDQTPPPGSAPGGSQATLPSQPSQRREPRPQTGQQPRQGGGPPPQGQQRQGGGGPQQPPGQQQQVPAGQQPSGRPQHHRQVVQQVHDRLASLDSALASRQREAERQVQSLPPNTDAQSIAISKHNLIVEVRASLNDIAAGIDGR